MTRVATDPLAGIETGLRPRVHRRRRGSLAHPAGTGLLLVLPAVAFVLVFALVPAVAAVGISLTSLPLIGDWHWVGLTNYVQVLGDPVFLQALAYTLAYTGIVTIPILVIGYVLAVLVRRRRRGSTLLRTLYFLPFVVGITTLTFFLVLEAQPGSGAINLVLQGLGITDGQTAWVTSGPLATGLLCVFVIWSSSGLTMVLIMSAMQGVSGDVLESAQMDGAGWWQRERDIVLPLVRRTILLTVIISVIGSFLAFNQFFIFTQGGPGVDTSTVVVDVYKRAFVQLQLGSSSAESILLIVVVAVITAVQFRFLGKDDAA